MKKPSENPSKKSWIDKPSTPYMAAAIATAIIAVIALVKECTGEKQSDKPKIEALKTAKGRTTTLRDEPEIVLRKSGDESSDDSNRKKLHLAEAIEKGDTEAATLIYNAIKETCEDKYLAYHAETNAKQIQCHDLSDVTPRSECEMDLASSANEGCRVGPRSLEERILCYNIALAKYRFGCAGESAESPREICLKQAEVTDDQVWNDDEELRKACPRQEAEKFGVNLDTITELNKIAQTERLKKQRTKFLTNQGSLSQDDIEAYNSTLNHIFGDRILEDFGDIDRFGDEYVYDVAESWRTYGEQFEEAATDLEQRWETGRFYYIAAEEVGSGITYYTD